jgi:hypothetical protein
MRVVLAGLAALAIVLALALGWATGRPSSAGALTVTRVAAERPLQMLPNPNEAPQASLDAFAQALGPSPAPPKPVAEGAPPKPAPPPEPDVAGIFRRQLTAVVEQGTEGRLAVLLAGEGASRLLKPGQDFMAGWKLKSVEMNQVVLARGRERKSIALFDARGGPSVPQLAPGAPPPASSSQPDASGEPMAQNDRVLTREASA